ncbi:MAG: BON domain-containing protein [Bacteroidota bacterium]
MAPHIEELIKQDIIDQLTWDDSVNANDVIVEVTDNTVQLKGKVPNYIAKLAAERDARFVSGVKRVENYLEVEFPPKSTLPSDQEITDHINSMLFLHGKIISSDVSVSTNRGVVTLSGKVGTYWEKNLAEDIASSTRGVVGVNNLLAVSLIKTVFDYDIETDIKNAYKRSILIDEDKIKVAVEGGTVRLTGSVANYAIKNEAIEIAMYTAGVKDVIDEITIE